jgi:hypothetical protein
MVSWLCNLWDVRTRSTVPCWWHEWFVQKGPQRFLSSDTFPLLNGDEISNKKFDSSEPCIETKHWVNSRNADRFKANQEIFQRWGDRQWLSPSWNLIREWGGAFKDYQILKKPFQTETASGHLWITFVCDYACPFQAEQSEKRLSFKNPYDG